MSRVCEPLNPTEAHGLQPWVSHLVGARDLDSLVSHCRRCYKRLSKAAGEYWTAKGLGVDEQSKY